jgi:Protein of unknown function (DUF4232)
MNIRVRRTAAVLTAAVALGAGTAAWAASPASAAPAATPPCTAANLAVWVNADSASGAAGTISYDLKFTNTGGYTCHLIGYPGVSAIDFSGRQLGAPARRVSDAPARIVNIPPDGTAHSNLGYIEVQVDPSCRPVRADLLRVFPPYARGARHAFFDLTVCTTGLVDLTVDRVQPGV